MNNEAISRNLESWQQRTPIHLQSTMYKNGIEILRNGGITLSPPTDTEIGEIKGKKILHVQCHIGLDTFSLARLGANVTGLDFSTEAIKAAKELSTKLGIDADFVVSDSQQADKILAGRKFDMVFASFGVFCWIENIQRWFQSASNLLAPGGVLYFADFHPILDIIDDDPAKTEGYDFKHGYFDKAPMHFPAGPTYADDGSGKTVAATIEFMHTLGDFVTTVAQSGLKIDYLHEFDDLDYQHYDCMIKQPNGTWDFPEPLTGKLPKIFSIRATKT